MVLGKTPHLELHRRVVVYYLLFCLATVVWLAVGAVVVARSVINSRSENARHSQMERVSSRLELAYLRSGSDDLQELVERIRKEAHLAYCAVVTPEGTFVAHSISQYVGTKADDPVGERQHWGEIESIDFQDDGRDLREYRMPLRKGNRDFATLRMAVAQPNAVNMMLSTAECLPVALVGPIVLLAVGAFVLQRVVRPLASVDAQLRLLAVAPAVDQVLLHKVPVRGPGSLGWNRLVGDLECGSFRSNFEERIGEAIQSRIRNKTDVVLNSLPDGVATTDDQGDIVFANRAFLAFVGRAPQEQLPPHSAVEDCLDLRTLSPDSPFFSPEHIGRHVIAEVKRTGLSGDRFLRLARYPMRGGNGESGSGHVWTVRDVTQQRLADKMRDEFLDSATHELRTPLTNIRAYAETLTLGEMLDVEQQKEFCNTINNEATRLARLIDDLLSVSSMEAGSLSITRKNTDVERLLRDVSSKILGQMDQKNITFEVMLSEKLPEMPLDKDKISASLINLLGNAAKYTPAGGRVALKARVAESQLVIEVEDNGIGISEAELPKVFGKFFRSCDERVQNITGTGLGLSLAYEIIRLHGGSMTVRSELNKGSTFTVMLRV